MQRGQEAWKTESACRGMDPSLFVPQHGQKFADAARQACENCPVALSCLDYAVMNHLSGLYSNTTDRERKRMRREGYMPGTVSARHLVKRLPDVITDSI
jgi:Transcription factor WhiB